MTWTCGLCREQFTDVNPIDHLRIMHAVDVTPETWPDGEVVIHDTTLEPEDFE